MLGIFAGAIIFIIAFVIWGIRDFVKSWGLIFTIICSLLFFTLSCYKVTNNISKQYWNTINEDTLEEINETDIR